MQQKPLIIIIHMSCHDVLYLEEYLENGHAHDKHSNISLGHVVATMCIICYHEQWNHLGGEIFIIVNIIWHPTFPLTSLVIRPANPAMP